MKDDYIRRKNMLNAVEKLDIIPSVDGMGIPTGAEDFRVQFLGTVLKVEPADVVQIKHSRWIKTADGAECEKCGREAVYQIIDNHWAYEPFCPHCGAIMNVKE